MGRFFPYDYRPASAETRRLQSESQRRRLGIPPGHRIIAGFIVPETQVMQALAKIYPCERCGGPRSAGARKCQKCADEVAGELKAEVLRRLQSGETSSEIQAALGVTRGKVSGIAFRAGISLRAITPKVMRPAPSQPPAQPVPDVGQWVLSAPGNIPQWPVVYWHSSRKYGGWLPFSEGAVSFQSPDDARIYVRKKAFPRYVGATPAHVIEHTQPSRWLA